MVKTKQVNAIHRGVDVLDVLAQGLNRLEDIYPRLGLSKSTTHRILVSLSAVGLAFQNSTTRMYYLGPTLLRLSSNPAVSHQMLSLCANDELMRLSELTSESALLVVACGSQRVVVKEITSPLDISFSFKEGHSLSMHSGSSGKVLLSMMNERDFEAVLCNLELTEFGPNTITDKEVLRKEIKAIRRQKYSISFGETQVGTAGVTVPIKNYSWPAAMCILGPQFRFVPKDTLEELKMSASRVSAKLLEIYQGTNICKK